MKRFKFLLLTLFVITGAGVLFAFNSKKQDSSPKEKMFSVVYYTYTPVSPATNPPSSSNDVTTTGNWTSVGGAPTNCGSPVTPNKICYITFDTGNTQLSDALSILGNQYPTYADNTTYTNGTHSVTVFLKR